MDLDVIRECDLASWSPSDDSFDSKLLQSSLERGQVLYFPKLRFEVRDNEMGFLSERWSDGKAKNVSLRGSQAELRGANGPAQELEDLRLMIRRFAESSERLVDRLFPGYRKHWVRAGTSFRPLRIEGRATSWRKDDTRLHVDAFPSNPTQGARLLRVFTNVNPGGAPRVWRLGEPFRDFAEKFLPRITWPMPGSAWLMHCLRITKKKRTRYDHVMLQLHDLVKADPEYQDKAPQITFPFPPGTTWIVFSDQALHAAMAGQFMLEQTFDLEIDGLADPATSPLRTLEALTGRKLAAHRRTV